MPRRSFCPIANALDHVGDKWSLLIIRDIALYGKRSYKALQESEEGIATNILSNRLASLESTGLLDKQTDPNDKRKKIYSLTEAGKDLIPVVIEMLLWSAKYDPEAAIPPDFLERAQNDKDNLIKDIKAAQGGESRS